MSAAAAATAANRPQAPPGLRRGLPPGPRLPLPLQTVLAIFAGERFAGHCLRRYDAMVTLRIAGLGTVVSVFDPELVKSVFTGDPGQWLAGAANAKFLRAPAGVSSVW